MVRSFRFPHPFRRCDTGRRRTQCEKRPKNWCLLLRLASRQCPLRALGHDVGRIAKGTCRAHPLQECQSSAEQALNLDQLLKKSLLSGREVSQNHSAHHPHGPAIHVPALDPRDEGIAPDQPLTTPIARDPARRPYCLPGLADLALLGRGVGGSPRPPAGGGARRVWPTSARHCGRNPGPPADPPPAPRNGRRSSEHGREPGCPPAAAGAFACSGAPRAQDSGERARDSGATEVGALLSIVIELTFTIVRAAEHAGPVAHLWCSSASPCVGAPTSTLQRSRPSERKSAPPPAAPGGVREGGLWSERKIAPPSRGSRRSAGGGGESV